VIRGHRVDLVGVVMMEPLSILISYHVVRFEYVIHILVHIDICHKTDPQMVSSMRVVKLEVMPAVAILDS
jgi:hypothetical protein